MLDSFHHVDMHVHIGAFTHICLCPHTRGHVFIQIVRAEFSLYQAPNSYAPSSTTGKTELPLLPLTIWCSIIAYKLRREDGVLLKKRGSGEFCRVPGWNRRANDKHKD